MENIEKRVDIVLCVYDTIHSFSGKAMHIIYHSISCPSSYVYLAMKLQ